MYGHASQAVSSLALNFASSLRLSCSIKAALADLVVQVGICACFAEENLNLDRCPNPDP